MTGNSRMALPSLVLTVGGLAGLAAADAQSLFLRSDPWRGSAARFLMLEFAQNGTPSLAPLLIRKRAVKLPVMSRRQALSSMVASARDLSAALEHVIHALRAHERLVKSGLDARAMVPLQVILLADLCAPESAAIFPVLSLVQSMLAREPYCQISLLLSTACFAQGKKQEDAQFCLYAGLKDLYAFLDGTDSAREQVARAMGLACVSAMQPQVYLFDRYKDGAWEVKDAGELRVIMGNLLLALLTSELGLHLDPGLGISEAPVFGSAGANALVFDPFLAIECCAHRFAVRTIENEFLATAAAPVHVIREAAQAIAGALGDERDWLKHLLDATPYSLRVGEAAGLDVHFGDLSFENLPVDEWSYAIHGHAVYFGTVTLSAACQTLGTNAQTLLRKVLGAQADLMESLPLDATLYPGGLDTAQKVIQAVQEMIQDMMRRFPVWDTEDHTREDMLQQDFAAALKVLDDAVESLPQPPHWVRLLPLSLSRLMRFIFDLLYLRHEYANLVALRQAAIRILENKCALLLEREARVQVNMLCQQLLELFSQAAEDIQSLRVVFSGLVQYCAKRAEKRGLVQSVFRQNALDAAMLQWIETRWRLPDEKVRMMLLDERELLTGWRATDPRRIESEILTIGREMYQPVWQLTLDEILAGYAETDLQPIWAAMAQGAMPLIRPDFDQAGGSGQSFQSQYFLCESLRTTPFAPFLRAPLANWEPLPTGEPYIAMCVRVRLGLSCQSLAHVWQRGRLDWDRLPEARRAELQIFGSQ